MYLIQNVWLAILSYIMLYICLAIVMILLLTLTVPLLVAITIFFMVKAIVHAGKSIINWLLKPRT